MKPAVVVVEEGAALRARLSQALGGRNLMVVSNAEAARALEEFGGESEDTLDRVAQFLEAEGRFSVVLLAASTAAEDRGSSRSMGLGSLDREASTTPATASLGRVEWEYIQRVLRECGGNISQAARLLGINRRSLQRKLAKYPPVR